MSLIPKGTTFDDRIHEVTMSLDEYKAQSDELFTWLVDNFGHDEDSGLWDMWEWSATRRVYFTFYNEEDAMAFKLAWT